MKKIKCIVVFYLFSVGCTLQAQQLKDGVPVEMNGLEVTFRVVAKESITVNDAAFDRYKVVASVKNISGKSFNIRLRSYPDLAGINAGKLVEVNCLNATGARLTAKKLDIAMTTHFVNVSYNCTGKDGKITATTLPVPVGYFLDEGQSAESNGIFIVPAGQEPQVNARLLK